MENKTLVIAEKPSVGISIAKVLGASKRREGYLEGAGFLVSWCIGHLADFASADVYDPKYSQWTAEDLPIIPENWKYRIYPDTREQFDTVTALMKDEAVRSIVCATDAGREGELIFRRVYQLCNCEKPVKRLWISSMEETAIRKGFESLSDSRNYDNLYHAALCRAKADWLVGINATRLFTSLYHGKTLNVGRVMTPTLELLAQREIAIRGFRKEKFYTVELDFQSFRAASGKFSSRTDAEALRTACLGKPVVVRSIERKEKTEGPSKLYDLTSLQRDANRLLGYTAKQTLDYLQSLYEKRLATYPRTDSHYLTEDMATGLPSLCSSVAGTLPFVAGLLLPVNATQVINGTKVSDHHAVIPTVEITDTDLAAMPSGERNILHLIATRLLCAVGEPHTYAETAVTLECGGAVFSAKGHVEITAGWKALERAFLSTLKQRREEASPALPELTEGQVLEGTDALLKQGATTPPAHFTEDTLLLAMERAGAEDFAELEDVEHKGLGTPATRAGIIEKLVRIGFVARRKRQLVPTESGMALASIMPEQLKSATLTAQWEERLGAVERGELAPEAFMAGITEMLTTLVQNYKITEAESSVLSQSGRAVIGVCPRCGKSVVEGKKSFFCESYYSPNSCGFTLWKNDRFFTKKRQELTKHIAAALLKDGRVHLTGLYSEQKDTLYNATVALDDTGGKFVHYKLEFETHGKKRRNEHETV